MNQSLLRLLQLPGEHDRHDLAGILDVDERTIRSWIVELREDGYPIIAAPSGGYRLAQNDEEFAHCVNQYRSRARKQLRTAAKMVRRREIEGQGKFFNAQDSAIAFSDEMIYGLISVKERKASELAQVLGVNECTLRGRVNAMKAKGYKISARRNYKAYYTDNGKNARKAEKGYVYHPRKGGYSEQELREMWRDMPHDLSGYIMLSGFACCTTEQAMSLVESWKKDASGRE